MDSEVKLRAIRYGQRKNQGDSAEDDAYKREPFKFLWTYSGEKAQERHRMIIDNERMDNIQEHTNGRKIVGTVLVMREAGLPGFGSLYQQSGSNFILHSDNIERVLKIPYYPKASETRIVSSKCWYIDAMFKVLYTLNMINFISTCVALINLLKDTYTLVSTLPTDMIINKAYMSFYVLIILNISFLFSIGHAIAEKKTLYIINLYILVALINNCCLLFYQHFYQYISHLMKICFIEMKDAMVNERKVGKMDQVQAMMECCGMKSLNDWLELNHTKLPRSCCVKQFSMDIVGKFDCNPENAHAFDCGTLVHEMYTTLFSNHSFMFKGAGIIQWASFTLSMFLAIAIVNGGLEQKNNINYDSYPPTEYFNIVTKGEVEFYLPMIYYEDTKSDDYKYMILMGDIRNAIHERQMNNYLTHKYMMFDIV